MKVLVISTVLLTVILCVPACDSESPTKFVAVEDGPVVSPAESFDAEASAVILSRDLLAPEALYERLESDLASIRGAYSDSVPAVMLRVRPSAYLGRISVLMDTIMQNDTSSAGYKVFDSLNTALGLDTIYHTALGWQALLFSARYNPRRLVELYDTLEIVHLASAGGVIGDASDLLVYPDGRVFKYFFREAWGDCPAGCTAYEAFYFSSDRGRIKYHGAYRNAEQYPPPPPAWIDTFYMARDTMWVR